MILFYRIYFLEFSICVLFQEGKARAKERHQTNADGFESFEDNSQGQFRPSIPDNGGTFKHHRAGPIDISNRRMLKIKLRVPKIKLKV